MSLAESLWGAVLPLTDRLTECGIPPLEVAGAALWQAADVAIDLLDAVEMKLPVTLTTHKAITEGQINAFELGRESVRVLNRGGRPVARPAPVRHLRAVKEAQA